MGPYSEDIEQCLHVLHAGGLILYPTDTIWGIGCDATNPLAVARIYQLKRRDDTKSMIVLVDDEETVTHYVKHPDPQIFSYLRTIARPTTVIYPAAKHLAGNLSSDGSIAVRICKNDFCIDLIRRFGKPIVSTSANFSGEPSPGLFKEVNLLLKKGVDYIVKYRQDDARRVSPSMLIAWENGAPVVLRS